MTSDHARPRWGRIIAVVALAALPVLVTACSSDDDTASDDTSRHDTASSASSSTSAEPAGDTPASGTIEINAVDYKYEGVPDEIAAGSKIALHNSSTDEVHEMVVFKIPDTEERSGAELAKLPVEQLQAAFAGPPALVMVAPPGADGFAAVGDGTLSEPGRYMAICAIPVGADPQAYMAAAAQSQGGPVSVPGGDPHYMQDMWAEFTVV